jgi:hypothetical protein
MYVLSAKDLTDGSGTTHPVVKINHDNMINQVENVFHWTTEQKRTFYQSLSAVSQFKEALDKLPPVDA